MLTIIILSGLIKPIKMNVIMTSVIMPSVVAPSSQFRHQHLQLAIVINEKNFFQCQDQSEVSTMASTINPFTLIRKS